MTRRKTEYLKKTNNKRESAVEINCIHLQIKRFISDLARNLQLRICLIFIVVYCEIPPGMAWNFQLFFFLEDSVKKYSAIWRYTETFSRIYT